MKTCSRCKKEKPIEEFNFKIKAKNLHQSHCKECTRFFIKNHYNNNQQYYLRKAQKRNQLVRLKINKHLYQYLSKHPCVDCGESEITVLEFDHQGNAPKLKAVSRLVRSQLSIEKIQEEIDKCEVRCANCHRRKTARDFKWFRSMRP